MGTSPIVVRPAGKADARELSRVLALAFDQDPPMVWLFPGPVSRRRRQLRRMFLTLFRREVCARGGARVATDGGRIVGAALWLPPRKQTRVQASLLRQLMVLAGLPAYLESSSLANVPMYEHFGFESTGTVPPPTDAPVLTSVWRTPQR